jgi:hypothetical protein
MRIPEGKSGGKRPLRRSRRRWEGDIKMDLKGIGRRGMELSDLAQDMDQRKDVVNKVMNFWVP